MKLNLALWHIAFSTINCKQYNYPFLHLWSRTFCERIFFLIWKQMYVYVYISVRNYESWVTLFIYSTSISFANRVFCFDAATVNKYMYTHKSIFIDFKSFRGYKYEVLQIKGEIRYYRVCVQRYFAPPPPPTSTTWPFTFLQPKFSYNVWIFRKKTNKQMSSNRKKKMKTLLAFAGISLSVPVRGRLCPCRISVSNLSARCSLLLTKVILVVSDCFYLPLENTIQDTKF